MLGSSYILKGVEAAILAGIGSVMGSLVGGIVLGVTEAVGSLYFPQAYRGDAYASLNIFGVDPAVAASAGLFGGRR